MIFWLINAQNPNLRCQTIWCIIVWIPNYCIFAIWVMKIFAFILSFYILALTALPCIDVPEDNNLDMNKVSQNTSDGHTNDSDHCSPFCSCSCCVTPVIHQVYSIDFKCFYLVEEYHSEFRTFSVSSPAPIIWQPPKIG